MQRVGEAALRQAQDRVSATPVQTDDQFAQREAEHERQRRGAALSSLISQAGGNRYAKYSFGAWKPASTYQQRVKATVEEYAGMIEDRIAAQEGLVLFGPVGTGKDHLMMAAMGQAVITKGVSVAWQNCQDLFGEVRDRISAEQSEAALIRRMEAAQVLVLSDLLPPVGGLTQHQSTMLYRVVENRYAAGRVTCATLNVSDDAEADALLGEPTWDRLCDRAWKVFCNWGSHRKPSRELKPE